MKNNNHGILGGVLMVILFASGCDWQGTPEKAQFKKKLKEKGFVVNITYEQSPLPYVYKALEPYLDARTVEIHYTKHHKGYVEKLNTAVEKHPELFKKPLEELLMHLDRVPEDIRLAVRNQGGGHWAHEFFWHCMAPAEAPQAPRMPKPGQLKTMIDAQYGSFEGFKLAFEKVAMGLFGSGWTWLVLDTKTNKLTIVTTPNHDLPQREGLMPLLVLDIWEHAYYLKFQNRRADFISQWWNVVNWDFVATCLEQYLK